jgi:RHS repeat-associated protein
VSYVPFCGNLSAKVVDYKYDYNNRWIYKNLDLDGTGGAGANYQTAFVYDGNQIAMQFDRANSEYIQATDLSHRYLYGSAVDQILADEQLYPLLPGEGQGEGYRLDEPGNVLWTLGDHLNTVRDLAVYTSGQTTVATHRVFDAFGKETYSTAGPDSIIGFTGKPFDHDTNLQNNINRWYEAGTGKWLSTDPIGFDGGDGNLYRYVGNGPVNAVDATGLTIQVLPEIVKNIDLYSLLHNESIGGFSFTTGGWKDKDVTPNLIGTFDVSSCICASRKLSIFSTTISEEYSGTIQVFRYNILSGADSTPARIKAAQELTSLINWEENAHKNAALRWFHDYKVTGFGVACDYGSALVRSLTMARWLSNNVQRMLEKGQQLESSIIDSIGDTLEKKILGG